MMASPSDDLVKALGLSTKSAALFARAGVLSLAQAWLYLPSRYEDRSSLLTVADFVDGEMVQFEAEVLQTQIVGHRSRLLTVQLSDTRGKICQLRYFHFYPSQMKQFLAGRRGVFYGKAVYGQYGFEVHHPEIQWLDDGDSALAQGIVPIYPTIKGLTQGRWRSLMVKALVVADALLPVHDALVDKGMVSLPQALRGLHVPDGSYTPDALLAPDCPLRQRLIMEEL